MLVFYYILLGVFSMGNINYDFIHKEEGGVKNKDGVIDHNLGYWPGGISGLTIAKGIDLSYFSEQDLKDAGVLEKDIAQVRDIPGANLGYIKKKTKGPNWRWVRGAHGSAIATAGNIYDSKIRVNGKNVGYKVEWSDTSTKAMQKWVQERYTKSAEDTYNKIVKDKSLKFNDLTKDQQTVLYSITYNAGENFIEDVSKDLKKAIENNDWIAIEKELMSKDKWLTNKDRRFREGDYLRKERLKRQKKEDTSFFFPDNGLMPKDIPV